MKQLWVRLHRRVQGLGEIDETGTGGTFHGKILKAPELIQVSSDILVSSSKLRKRTASFGARRGSNDEIDEMTRSACHGAAAHTHLVGTISDDAGSTRCCRRCGYGACGLVCRSLALRGRQQGGLDRPYSGTAREHMNAACQVHVGALVLGIFTSEHLGWHADHDQLKSVRKRSQASASHPSLTREPESS